MHAPSESILSYFNGTGTDDRGRLLADVQKWSDDVLEGCHDQIQWMFPVPEPSKFNWNAPLLTPEVIAQFTPAMRDVLRVSFWRMMKFYGFNMEDPYPRMSVPEDFNPHWLHPMDHNLLRLTRILRCLRLLGLESEMKALFEVLTVLYTRELAGQDRITNVTYQWWEKAATQDNW
jgi:hypothetical protein